MTGISRKLPVVERNRLKRILKDRFREDAGVIVRTAAEGASEEELTHDINRLRAQWEGIESQSKSTKVLAPDGETNSWGYYPVRAAQPDKCIACGNCYAVCPDVAITVYKL